MKQIIFYKGSERIESGFKFSTELEEDLINHSGDTILKEFRKECNEMIFKELCEKCNELDLNMIADITSIVIE